MDENKLDWLRIEHLLKLGICAAFFPERGVQSLRAAEASVSCEFVRSHTLASGGPYCDCGYKKTDWSGAR